LSRERRVDIRPLAAADGAKLRAEIWKVRPGAVLDQDMTLAGAIVLGTGRLLDIYLGLSDSARRVLTALCLAGTCDALPCEQALLFEILDRIIGGVSVDERNAAIAVLKEKDILVENDSMYSAKYGWYTDKHFTLRADAALEHVVVLGEPRGGRRRSVARVPARRRLRRHGWSRRERAPLPNRVWAARLARAGLEAPDPGWHLRTHIRRGS
jgi:hypothetical protein